MKPLRILVIGHGLIGSRRAEAVQLLRRTLPVELAGTVDPENRDPDLYRSVPHFSDLDEVRPDSYDAALIALPHHIAPGVTKSVLQAGRPVLVEKPLAATSATATEIAELSQRVDRPSFVGYNYRFLPTVKALLERYRDGWFGPLRNVDMVLGHGGNPDSAKGWKLSPERAGGGVLLDPGVHLFDLLLQLEPSLRLKYVAATRGFWKTGIEEDAVALFEQQGSVATVHVSLVRWINTFRIEVFGDDGYAVVEGRGGNYGPQRLSLGRRWGWRAAGGVSQRKSEEKFDFGFEDLSFMDELRAVIGRWLGEKPVLSVPEPASLDEAVTVMKLCDELYSRVS